MCGTRGGSGSGDQASTLGDSRRFGAGARAEFPENVGDVDANSTPTDEEYVRDLRVGKAFEHQLKNFAVTGWRQACLRDGELPLESGDRR